MESIEITWTALDFPENGGDEYTGYRVFWGEGSPSAEWKILGEFTTPVLKAMHADSSGVRGAAWLAR
jgi:hypothetical protein